MGPLVLHDKPTGVEDDPAYRVYLMDGVRLALWYDNRPRRWVADPVTEVQVLPLGKGVLGRAEKFTQTLASPAHCGAQGGEYCAIWLGPEMPGDQRADDAFSACLDTDPLPVLRLSARHSCTCGWRPTSPARRSRCG